MIGGLFFSAGCVDQANWIAFGFALGIISTGGILVAFMENWLRAVIRIGRDELREQAEVAELGLKLVPPAEPETRR